MTRPDPRTGITLGHATLDVLNRFLAAAALSTGHPDSVDVGVIGYGASVSSLLGPEASGSIVSISELRSTFESSSDAVFGPPAFGSTPMVAALTLAEALLRSWVQTNVHAAPPIVVNITDGASTDGDPRFLGETLRSITTATGVLELCTVQLDIDTEPIWFPNAMAGLRGDQQVLAELASALSPGMRQRAEASGHHPGPGSHACVVGANAGTLHAFLDIVSPAPLRLYPSMNRTISRPSWRTSDHSA